MFLKTTQMCERYYKRLQKKDEHTAAAGQHSAELLRTRTQLRSGVNVPPSFTQTAPLMSLGGDVTNTSTDTSFRHMSSVPPLPLMAANLSLTVVAPTPTSATAMPSAAAAQSLPTSLRPEAPAPMVVYAPARTGLTGPSTHLCLSAAPGENQFAADQSLLRRRKRRPKTCSVCGHIEHFGKFKEYHAAEGTNSERCDVPETDHALPMDRYSGACKCVVCQALIAPLERDGHYTARLRRAASANVPSGTRRTTWLKQKSASSAAAEANNASSAIPAGSTPTLSSAPVPSGPHASSSVNNSSTTVTRSHVPSTLVRPSPPVSVPIPMVSPSPPMSTRSARARERVVAASPARSNSLPNHESPQSPLRTSSPPHVPVYKPSRFRSVLTTDTMQVPSAGSEELQDDIDPADMLLLSTPVVLPPPSRRRPGAVHVVPSSRPVLANAASTHVHRKPSGLRMVTTTSTSQPARAPAAAINPSASATRVRTQHTQA